MESPGKRHHRCLFCDFKFDMKYKLESHMSTHTREKPFFCGQCNTGFSRKSSLQLHIQAVHQGIKRRQEKRYKCSICPYAAHYRYELEAHTRRHTGERNFQCKHPSCDYAGKSSQDIREHNSYKHTTVRNFLCPFPNCGYRGKTAGNVRIHALSHSEDRPFVCDFHGCSYRAKRTWALTCHKREVHHGGYKPFACSKCNFQTATKALLKNHQLVHNEKSIRCTFIGCPYSCKSERNLRYHVLNRHQEKTVKCDFKGCSATAASQQMLRQHKKDKHSEKVHKCPTCDYRALHPSIMQKHIATHNTRNTIPCPTKGCTFLARHQYHLRVHMRYHDANLGCPMEGCGYVSISISRLKRHMKIHDPTGRPIRCPLCPKRYQSNHVLSLHLPSHTKEKPFKCPVCNFGAITKTRIADHVRSMHSKVLPNFVFDKDSVCDHCNVNFGCSVGLVMHKMRLKSAVVVLTKLQLIQK